MTKPDRWTRLVEKVEARWRDSRTNGTVHLISSEKAKHLLRKEHAATVRAVKMMAGALNPTIATKDWGKGYVAALADVLAWLEARKQ